MLITIEAAPSVFAFAIPFVCTMSLILLPFSSFCNFGIFRYAIGASRLSGNCSLSDQTRFARVGRSIRISKRKAGDNSIWCLSAFFIFSWQDRWSQCLNQDSDLVHDPAQKAPRRLDTENRSYIYELKKDLFSFLLPIHGHHLYLLPSLLADVNLPLLSTCCTRVIVFIFFIVIASFSFSQICLFSSPYANYVL